jgi:predicted transcriptional regulator
MGSTVCLLLSSMSILISLSPEIEAQLQEKAISQGRDISSVANDFLSRAMELDDLELQESIKAIQEGFDDFEAGRSQSFQSFVEEQRSKHGLLIEL